MHSLYWRYFSLFILFVFLTNSETARMSQSDSTYDLVYVLTQDGTPDIYRLSLLDGESIRLTSDNGDNYNIAVSPNGSQIAFGSNRDGNFEIYVMNADGSEQKNVTNSERNDFLSGWSPDGTELLFTTDDEAMAGGYLLSLASKDVQVLIEQDINDLVLSPNGQFVAIYEGEPLQSLCIFAVATNTKDCIVDSIGTAFRPLWSPDSTQLLFEEYQEASATNIYIVNTDGTEFRRLSPEGSFQGGASWSPDGTQIAFHEVDRTSEFPFTDVFVMNADGTDPVQFTDAPGPDSFPSWSPDGTQIAFYAARDGNGEIYVMDVDGNNQRRLTFTTGEESEINWIRSN